MTRARLRLIKNQKKIENGTRPRVSGLKSREPRREHGETNNFPILNKIGREHVETSGKISERSETETFQ